MHTTPVSLLQRLQRSPAAADWTSFVHLYTPLLYRWAVQSGLQPADASDLIQDVLLTLVKELSRFNYDPRKSFRAWLYTIAMNRLRNTRKSPSLRPLGSSALPENQPGPDLALDLEETEYRQYLVSRALQLLQADFEPRTWKAFWEHVVEGRPASEVAAQFGVTPGAIYTARVRILDRLRKELAGLLD